MGATTSVRAPAGHFEERTLVMVLADLAGFTRAVGHLQALEIAEVLDRFYAMCGEQVAARVGSSSSAGTTAWPCSTPLRRVTRSAARLACATPWGRWRLRKASILIWARMSI